MIVNVSGHRNGLLTLDSSHVKANLSIGVVAATVLRTTAQPTKETQSSRWIGKTTTKRQTIAICGYIVGPTMLIRLRSLA